MTGTSLLLVLLVVAGLLPGRSLPPGAMLLTPFPAAATLDAAPVAPVVAILPSASGMGAGVAEWSVPGGPEWLPHKATGSRTRVSMHDRPLPSFEPARSGERGRALSRCSFLCTYRL